jgi:hypothetical protein
MWDQNDLQGFMVSSKSGIGQINLSSKFGKKLHDLAKDTLNKTFVEIGTWNGLGSTMCIYSGLKLRTDDWLFYSFETNTDKLTFAKNYYKNTKIIFSNDTILQKIPEIKDIENILNITIQDDQLKWLYTDNENMKKSKYFFSSNNLDNIDVLLLDGSEFYTYFEYLELRNKTNILCLDDINSIKCNRIYNELLLDNNWKLLEEDKNDRNGYAIFIRK